MSLGNMDQEVNLSELRMIVKEETNTDISRATRPLDIVSLLENGYAVKLPVCPLVPLKAKMEVVIQKNLSRLRTQLPQCNGKCTEFGCPDGVVTNCYSKLKHYL